MGAPNIAFTVAAFCSLAVRLSALVCVQAYVRAGASDNEVNQKVVDRLRQPTDGSWREVVKAVLPRLDADPHASRVARWHAAPATIPRGGDGWEFCSLVASPRVRSWFEPPAAGKKKGGQTSIPKAGAAAGGKDDVDGALGDLVTFRNKLLHGTAPTAEELDIALLRVEAVARGALEALGDSSLLVREGERGWRVMGCVPQPMEPPPSGLDDRVPTLVFTDGTPPLPLAPLVRFRPGDGARVEVDELFFVNAAALERLHYVGFRAGAQADGKELGTYEAFKAFWQRIPVAPSPKDPALAYHELAAFHGQYFVGRDDVLAELESSLAGPGDPGRYVELRALAGMGKTAVLARLYARQRAGGESESGLGAPLAGAWAFHFCAQTEGREYALVALRSVVAQLCDAALLKRESWLSNDLKELREERLPGLLAEVTRRAGRCVVVLDALDESTGSDDDALAGCLPEFVPEGVSFVVSWRVDAERKASRIDRQLARVPSAVRRPLATANPLAGLKRAHVRTFVDKVRAETASDGDDDAARPLAVPEATVEAVWLSATRGAPGADPFFLRFVAEGVRDERIDLGRAETVPASLDDAFEGQWLALPADKGFLAQRVLLLLGILREYGDDELVAELVAGDPQYRAEPDAAIPLRPEDVAIVRQRLGKLLVYDGERYGLFHDRFRRFLVGEQKDPIAEAIGEACGMRAEIGCRS